MVGILQDDPWLKSARLPPNGLAFSCRARAGRSCQNATDLARAAVNCNAGLGGRLGEL